MEGSWKVQSKRVKQLSCLEHQKQEQPKWRVRKLDGYHFGLRKMSEFKIAQALRSDVVMQVGGWREMGRRVLESRWSRIWEPGALAGFPHGCWSDPGWWQIPAKIIATFSIVILGWTTEELLYCFCMWKIVLYYPSPEKKNGFWGRPHGWVVKFMHSTLRFWFGSRAWTCYCSSSHAEAASQTAQPEALVTRTYNYVLGGFGEKKEGKKRRLGTDVGSGAAQFRRANLKKKKRLLPRKMCTLYMMFPIPNLK